MRALARLLMAACCLAPAFCQDQATALQQSGIRRVERYVDHFRRTGDQRSLLGELQMAERELAASYQAFGAANPAEAAWSLIYLGTCRRMQNQAQEALAIYTKALELAKQANLPGHQAKALVGMSRAEAILMRDYGSSLAHLDEALRLSVGLPDQSFYLDALEDKASLQSDRGELVAAMDNLNRLLKLVTERKDEVRLFYAYYYRADVYRRMADGCDAKYRTAVAACYEALDLAKTDYARAESLARKLGFLGLAEQMVQAAGRVAVSRQMVAQVQAMHSKMSEVRAWSPTKAADVLVTENFVSGGQTIPPGLAALMGSASGSDARSVFIQGTFADMQGNRDAALALYLKALAALEQDRRNLKDESSRGTFLESRIEFYDPPILHLLERHRYAEAFDLLERSRSRAMTDLLASRNPAFRTARERELYAAAAQIRAEISSRQKDLFERSASQDRERHAAAIEKLDAEIRTLEGQYQQALARMRSENPNLQELVVSQPVALDAVQRAMRQDPFDLLAYMIREDGVILWHIGPDAVEARSVFLPRAELARKVTELRQSLEDANAPFNETRARELYLFLVQPALSWLRTNHLVIVPHEELYSIPFQVLQDPADRRFLGERFQISYAPSATVLMRLRPVRGLTGAKLFAAADPALTDGQQEVRQIAELFPGPQTVITAALPGKPDMAKVAGHDVVHLAVHGKFDAREPMLSHLKLRKGPADDGLLTAAEMFGLPLERASLVALSACETGQVTATRSNETLGIVRALVYAGAQSLVLSAWAVDSASTSLWMQRFYKEALSKPLAEAARLASLAVKANPSYNHPFYWAPFLVTGR